jgi:hypothetical protein
MRPGRRGYLFGRVIRTDANAGGFPNSNLIYIYSPESKTPEPIPELLPRHLLLPPMMTNNLPWVRGYFKFVCHRPLAKGDLLPRHSFQDERGWLFNESGARQRRASSPIGEWALHSFRTIDDEISQALGLQLAAD